MKRTAFILIVLCRADTNRSSTFEAVPTAGLGWSKKVGQWIHQGIIDDCAMDFDNNAVITPREVSAYLQSRVDEANEDPNAD